MRFERDYTVMAPGSVLVTFGQTKVLCTASVEERVPPWMRGSGKGWVTAEYSMLPGSTPERASREAAKGKQSGRTQEIQRLIARSLRAVCDLVALGEVQITVDCDALQADGGTRTASICGAYVALHDACTRLVQKGTISTHPLTDSVAAVSVGIIDGVPMLDLPYVEDSRAEVDMNVVMTGAGRFVEVQGTAEGMAFTRSELDSLLGLAEAGIKELTDCRRPSWPSRHPGGERGHIWPAASRPGLGQSRQGQGDRGDPVGLLDVTLLPRPADAPDVVEDGETLLDNARLKARALVAATGTAAVADDTGLEVDALGGAPGVYSARYAGEDATYADNVAKLLRELAGLADGAGHAGPGSAPWPWPRSPTAPSCGRRARSRGRSPPRSGGAGSATTRSSCPRAATGGRSPRCGRRRRMRCRIGAGPFGRSPPAGRTGRGVVAVRGALRRPQRRVSAGPATPRRRAGRRWRTRGSRLCRWLGSGDRGPVRNRLGLPGR